jgi:hypothetical protein
MTGRYRITFAPAGRGNAAERLTRKRWSIFVHTCESLAADGLEYAVTFALAADDPHILITASGTVTRKRRQVGPRPWDRSAREAPGVRRTRAGSRMVPA